MKTNRKIGSVGSISTIILSLAVFIAYLFGYLKKDSAIFILIGIGFSLWFGYLIGKINTVPSVRSLTIKDVQQDQGFRLVSIIEWAEYRIVVANFVTKEDCCITFTIPKTGVFAGVKAEDSVPKIGSCYKRQGELIFPA